MDGPSDESNNKGDYASNDLDSPLVDVLVSIMDGPTDGGDDNGGVVDASNGAESPDDAPPPPSSSSSNPKDAEPPSDGSNDASDAKGGVDSPEEDDASARPPPSAGASGDAADGDAADGDDADGDDARPSEKTTAPEPPRWRFVNEAKKSLGYSSLHAGSYVRGKTADELGAKYVAPDVSLYTPKEAKAEAQKLEHQLPSNETFSKEDVEVGRLSGDVPPPNAFSVRGNEVGKLNITEVQSDETRTPSGKFAGLPRAGPSANESPKSFREWETNVELGPRRGREGEWYDGEVSDNYKMPGDDARDKTRGGVGRIKFHGAGESEESFVGRIARGGRGGDADGGEDRFDDNDSNGDPREGALFVARDSNSGSAIEKGSDGSTAPTEGVDDENERKKRRCLYLLLLLPLLIGAVIGGVVGRDDGGETPRAAGAVVGGLLIPPIIAANETNTTMPSYSTSAAPSVERSSRPSLSPSAPPSTECPEGTAPFSIEHRSNEREVRASMNGATWKVTDACSGDVIAQCLPCSAGSAESPPWEGAPARERSGGSTRRSEEDVRCLPVGNEYVLEVLPAGDSDGCCGFDPATAVVSYDDAVIRDAAASKALNGIFRDGSSSYFGEGDEPCPSESPSASPSGAPTPKPSESPTCSKEREFNLCVAVDMSGSVCNDGAGSECANCRASFLPMFFESECRDSSVDEDTCCNNFANVKEFSTLMVSLLGNLPGDESFSVVQFSTTARLVSGLSSAASTLPVIDGLDYTGGLTNHKAAIERCQAALPSFGDRKNFIMLITDGVSSEPGLDPEGEAEAAATAAKEEGTFVIPVFISPYNDWTALAFMRRLSSDGKVFDVTDFDSLNGLQDRLVDQVSCS